MIKTLRFFHLIREVCRDSDLLLPLAHRQLMGPGWAQEAPVEGRSCWGHQRFEVRWKACWSQLWRVSLQEASAGCNLYRPILVGSSLIQFRALPQWQVAFLMKQNLCRQRQARPDSYHLESQLCLALLPHDRMKLDSQLVSHSFFLIRLLP